MSEIVECHSEYEYAEKPVALTWGGQRLEIAEILERWRIPGAKCFRVRTADGQVFELLYGELYDEWRIHQP
jgi:hypothetical protein